MKICILEKMMDHLSNLEFRLVQSALITHCESTVSRFAILDVSAVDKLSEHRKQFDTTYAAMYHPWLSIFDPLLKKNSYTPLSGTIAGIYARVDNTRGVWKSSGK